MKLCNIHITRRDLFSSSLISFISFSVMRGSASSIVWSNVSCGFSLFPFCQSLSLNFSQQQSWFDDLMIWWFDDFMISWFDDLMIWWFDDLMIDLEERRNHKPSRRRLWYSLVCAILSIIWITFVLLIPFIAPSLTDANRKGSFVLVSLSVWWSVDCLITSGEETNVWIVFRGNPLGDALCPKGFGKKEIDKSADRFDGIRNRVQGFDCLERDQSIHPL